MKKPIFSVLIPAITERLASLHKLVGEIQRQLDETKRTDVEIISVVDNRIVSLGEKRQMVLDASHGDYVAYVDDDDWISTNYIFELTKAIDGHAGVDVITFNQTSIINGGPPSPVYMRLKQANEEFRQGIGCKRSAWHMCAWRGDLVRPLKFPRLNYNEDSDWVEQCNEAAQTEYHLNLFLHTYVYDKKISRAGDDLT
jgi:glycosyltransferase involved in cell wall biosynthesis